MGYEWSGYFGWALFWLVVGVAACAALVLAVEGGGWSPWKRWAAAAISVVLWAFMLGNLISALNHYDDCEQSQDKAPGCSQQEPLG
jgi:hypothetical protein